MMRQSRAVWAMKISESISSVLLVEAAKWIWSTVIPVGAEQQV
jgi:hypothetical protein